MCAERGIPAARVGEWQGRRTRGAGFGQRLRAGDDSWRSGDRCGMFIKSTVLTIEQVCNGSPRLELPWFQRAYAWSEMHVGRLIWDLAEAMSGPRRRYSLGHISLARSQPDAAASIIDGHQRLTSLTILFALLHDMLGVGPTADRLHLLIERPAGAYRFLPQPAVAEFFASYVQRRGTALIEPTGDIMDRSHNERNILANRDHMQRMLREVASTPAALTE